MQEEKQNKLHFCYYFSPKNVVHFPYFFSLQPVAQISAARLQVQAVERWPKLLQFGAVRNDCICRRSVIE
jgi:hypothetical protein